MNDTFVIPGNIFGYNKSMFVIKTVELLCYRYPTEDMVFGGEFNIVGDEWLDRTLSKYQGSRYNPLLLDL